jgi:hypothetical protein
MTFGAMFGSPLASPIYQDADTSALIRFDAGEVKHFVLDVGNTSIAPRLLVPGRYALRGIFGPDTTAVVSVVVDSM